MFKGLKKGKSWELQKVNDRSGLFSDDFIWIEVGNMLGWY